MVLIFVKKKNVSKQYIMEVKSEKKSLVHEVWNRDLKKENNKKKVEIP